MHPSNSLTQRLHVTPGDQAVRLRWIRMTDEEAMLIRAAGVYLRPEADDIVKRFYDHSFAFPEFLAKISESGSNRARLEAAQKGYLLKLLDGKFDEEYFEHRLKIGAVHAILNVEPRWNVGNYAVYADIVYPLLARKLKGERLVQTILAFNKAFMLDATLAIETYISEGVLQKLVDVNETLGGSVRSMDEGTGQVDSAAREIANAIQEIARGATEQTSSMSEMSEVMKQLAGSIASVAEGADEQYRGVEAARDATQALQQAMEMVSSATGAAADKGSASLAAAREGMTSVQHTVSAMDTIRSAVLETSGEVQELGRRSSEIGAIIQVIEDIASQTNLLALNAAIEAARAGEQGRGFAVVAENVRSLAERTAVATKEIATLIAAVQTGTSHAVKAMENSVRDVEAGSARAGEAGTALSQIVDSATELNNEIVRIAGASASVEASVVSMGEIVAQVGAVAGRLTGLARDMRGGSESALESITSATAVAEQSAAASEQVSAGVEEVSAQIGELATLSRSLASISDEMATFLARFGVLAHNSAGVTFKKAA